MADNIAVTPGVGATVATDDVSSVHFQKVKLDCGDDGASIPVVGTSLYGIPVDVKRGTTVAVTDSGGSLTVDSAQLPLALAANGGLPIEGVAGGVAVPVSGTVAATSTQLPAALAANGGLKIEGVAGGVVVPVADGSGSLTVDSAQLPVALAAGGGLKIEGVAGGVAVPVIDTNSAANLTASQAVADAIKTTGGAVGTKSVLISGTDGVNVYPIHVHSSDGHLGVHLSDTTGAELDLFKDGDNAAGASDHSFSIMGLDEDSTPDKYRMLRCSTGGYIRAQCMYRPASTATLANVSTSTGSAQLLAANANRLGGIIYNDSAVNMYLKYGTTASSTSFTVLLLAGGTHIIERGYTGRIDGILASSTGNARVTELTA